MIRDCARRFAGRSSEGSESLALSAAEAPIAEVVAVLARDGKQLCPNLTTWEASDSPTFKTGRRRLSYVG